MRTLIDVDQVRINLDNPNWQIIDCRFSLADEGSGFRAYQDQHIRGAIYAHLNNQLSGTVIAGKTGRHPLPEINDWIDQVLAWGLNPSKQVVAYDDAGGAFAARLWWLLRWIGHESVAVLDGGWQAWIGSDLPTNRLAPMQRPLDSDTTQYDSDPGLTKQVSVVQMMDHDFLLLDARDEARFRGEIEPIDPVAGHIPGAVCAPFSDNLGADGFFKSKAELTDRFTNLITPSEHRPVVCYCGSGVTATHNILAMVHAGLPEPGLYPGSWSEWITDPERPIEQ
jgi:thiosulfate/3-mercaptopyruvate sulfurtransferase